MFDTYNPSTKVNVNAVSGTLSKTCEKSFFRYGHIKSNLFEVLMSNAPILLDKNGQKKPVVVLQAMILGNDYIMFEVIFEQDFEQLKKENDTYE